MSGPLTTATTSEGRRESAAAVLARNLVVARQASGLTQHQLAAASDVSRATIAQLETGVSDPRLSTVSDLARALNLPPALLLIGAVEVEALARLPEEAVARPLELRPSDVYLMRDYLASGLLKDRNRAARVGAATVRAGGDQARVAAVLAALFSAVVPGKGTSVGAALGRLLG